MRKSVADLRWISTQVLGIFYTHTQKKKIENLLHTHTKKKFKSRIIQDHMDKTKKWQVQTLFKKVAFSRFDFHLQGCINLGIMMLQVASQRQQLEWEIRLWLT